MTSQGTSVKFHNVHLVFHKVHYITCSCQDGIIRSELRGISETAGRDEVDGLCDEDKEKPRADREEVDRKENSS